MYCVLYFLFYKNQLRLSAEAIIYQQDKYRNAYN